MFRLNDNIYYFEIKTNINLDTEKSKSTYNKILDIGEKLQYIFPRNEIKYSLLNLRFPTRFEVPPTLIKEPLKSFDGFYGYADFFNLFDINIIEQQWIDLCKEIDSKLLLLI